jgi:Zn-finger nucleic acid-binding protein
MNCPNDNTTLTMTDRAGIEIDYCPQCRGVWLDRGELDKIIERSEQQRPSAGATTSKPVAGQEYFQPVEQHPRFEGPNYAGGGHGYAEDYDKHHYDSSKPGGHGYKKKRKESFLGDMFDF